MQIGRVAAKSEHHSHALTTYWIFCLLETPCYVIAQCYTHRNLGKLIHVQYSIISVYYLPYDDDKPLVDDNIFSLKMYAK